MSLTMQLILNAIVQVGLESLTWGAFGYVFLRYLGLKAQYWYWDWILVFAVFIVFELWSNAVMLNLDISIGNQEALALIDNDLEGFFETDYIDVVLGGVEIFFGYWLGRFMFTRITQRFAALGA